MGRNYSELRSERVKESLLAFNTEQDKLNLCPNNTWTHMQAAFEDAADEICPRKSFYIKHDKSVYFTEDLKKAINERDNLYRLARLKKVDANWLSARKKKLEVRKLLIVAKRNYIKENLAKNAGNPVKYWKAMGKFLKQSKDPPITSVLDDNDVKISGVNAANVI